MQWLLSPDPWQLDCFTSSNGMGNIFEGDFVQRRIVALDCKPGDSVGLTITITLHRQHYVYIVYLLTLAIMRFWMWLYGLQSTHPTALSSSSCSIRVSAVVKISHLPGLSVASAPLPPPSTIQPLLSPLEFSNCDIDAPLSTCNLKLGCVSAKPSLTGILASKDP